MEFGVSDELLGTVMPIVVYWVYSGIYTMFGSFDEYRLHSKKDEDDRNLVSKGDVIRGVLLQQAVQAVVAIILFTVLLNPKTIIIGLTYINIYVYSTDSL